MGTRQYPWLRTDGVPWSDGWVYTRGTYEGLPLLSWGCADRDRLATRRQLRKQGLRPGGADPVAVLYFHHAVSGKTVYSDLFLVSVAVPVRAMTPAKWRAVHKALTTRRTCVQCGEDTGVYLPRERRVCEPCRYTLADLDPCDYLHDYLTGTPITPEGGYGGEWLAPVIPLRPSRVDTQPRKTEVA
ncbi:RRQRL motif-containing zinc-binding protein [Amycolatopsis sp. CA-230715]|uniref:RRQRL motif-containing zinc-binding protein n=1 Tax=Amycolatopsis sp. CA-230715 TaxID=2745196 RepID=UPI001C02851E|nr:RRQRL motif-containing zinc-binding protein [Amycolatopsis sp. CA-230715]QWF80453.1 hypothetical protein HUW46_03875 [Amycolatopsis sp. CA-230715]